MANETTITTREIPGEGVFTKGAPLTNAELDYNFIALNGLKLQASENLADLTDIARARENLELQIGSDVQPYDPQTARYYDTIANFTGSLQVDGTAVLTSDDIGSSIQAYDPNTVTFDAVGPQFTDTSALGIPVGTNEDRPDPASTGQIRYNSDSNEFEGYYLSGWGIIGTSTVLPDDDSTENYHVLFVDQTSGELQTTYVSPTDFVYDASSGTLSAGAFDATSSGFLVNGSSVIDSSGKLNLSEADFSDGTGAITLPSGTTAQRPVNPKVGDIRFNTDLGEFETYNGSVWKIMSPTVDKASVTRTFSGSETIEISLTESVFAPLVGVTKEVPQTGLTASDWSVDPSDYALHDTAYSTSITPSNPTGDGTFTLGSGSFRNEDVGKRVVGNGGEAILLSSAGEYTLTNSFSDGSTIPSGSWNFFDLTFDSSNGIQFETASEFADLSNSTFTRSYSVRSSDPEGLAFNRDGTRMYVSSDDHGLEEYTLSVPWNLESAYNSGGFDPGAREDVFVSDDGTRLYLMDLGGDIDQYNLSTPFDVDTASRVKQRDFQGSEGMFFRSDGTRMYTTTGDNIYQYDLSVPWDIGTASSSGSVDLNESIADMYIQQSDGAKLYILGDSSDAVFEYDLPTPWDISSATYTGDFYTLPSQGSSMEGLFFSDEGSMYVLTNGPDAVYQYTLGAESNVISSKYSSAITTPEGTIDTEYWTDINNMIVTDSTSNGDVYYAVSTDSKDSFDITLSGSGTRKIARNNSGVWEINVNEVYGGVTWQTALVNDIHSALQEAMDTPVNRMDGSQLESASDSDYFTLSTSLDLGIILFLPQSASTSPSSNGVSINYDGNIKNEAGVLGVDFEYEHPEPSKILFTNLSGSSENLKIRVV